MTLNVAGTNQCSQCGTAIPDTKLFCPSCGKPNRQQAPVTTYAPAGFQAYPATGAAPAQRIRVQPGSQSRPLARSGPAPVVRANSGTAARKPTSWETVLMWSVVTLGIGGIVYAFKQAAWAGRLDQTSTAMTRLTAWLALSVAAAVLMILAVNIPSVAVLSLVSILFMSVALVFGFLWPLALAETISSVAASNQVPVEPAKGWTIVCGVLTMLSWLGASVGVVYFQRFISDIEIQCGTTNP